jgi:hypothetical protein
MHPRIAELRAHLDTTRRLLVETVAFLSLHEATHTGQIREIDALEH